MNSLLAIVFVGLFLLCLSCLATAAFVVLRLTGSTEAVTPRKKLFIRAPKSDATPELVGAPKIVSSTEPAPMAGPDGVTHVDATRIEEYKDLQDIPKDDLAVAVEKYLRGEGAGTDAVGAAVEEAEK